MTTMCVVFVIGLLMFVWERRSTRHHFPDVSGWWSRAAVLNGLGLVSIFVCGTGLHDWLVQHRPWSAERLGDIGGGVVGYLVLSFVNYWWHRMRHQSGFLWRWFHQMHHSARRIEVMTTFYKHPAESLADSVGAVVILYGVVGVTPGAAALALLLCGVLELFFHWNVKTPHWLGFLIQRPEAHCIHHEEGLHAYNYSDLAIWDILFGTFRNPRHWDATCGLGAENERRVLEMLRGVDVTKIPEAGASYDGVRA